MKKRIAKKVLGLALRADRALLAEVAPGAGGRRQLLAVAEFVFPLGVGLAQPAALGAALGDFLREHGIGARDAIIGLPARTLMTRRCDVPAAAADMALANLRLQAESAFATDAQNVTVDFAGELPDGAAASGLLVATNRTVVEQCRELAATAHLRLRAVTATTPALSRITTEAPHDVLVINVALTGAELYLTRGGTPLQLRHVALPAEEEAAVVSLAAEIRRTLAGHPAGEPPWALAVWDELQARRNVGEPLHERLGLHVATERLDAMVAGADHEAPRYSPAVAVALAGAAGTLPVDFLHSRLAPPPGRSRRRRIAGAAALGFTLLLALVATVYNLRQRQASLALMQAKLAALRPQVRQAKTALSRLNVVRNWHSGSPQLLACFSALTNVFPADHSIYATSLMLRHARPDQLTGKANRERQVLDLRDRMNAALGFTDVSVVDVREAGPTSRQYEFSIAFKFSAPE